MRATTRYQVTGLLLSVLVAGAGGARAAEQSMWDIAFGATATSNYISRGQTQTLNDPAIQGFSEITGGQFYFGSFISNANFGTPDTEIDLSVGWRPTVGNFSFDFGAVEYLYVVDSDTSYPELYGFAKYKVNDTFNVGTKLYYAPDYSQLGFSALYAEGNTTVSLPNNFSFSGALGVQTFATTGRPDYLTWNAGFGYTWRSLTFDVRYWDTDLSTGECAITNVISSACDARVVASVSIATSASAIRQLTPGR